MALRAIGIRMCSPGACCEQEASECGIQIVGIPRVSVKTSLQNEPPDEGMMAGLPFEERCSERATKFTQG